MASLTALRILPRLGLYTTYRSTPRRQPDLETIPRIPNMPNKAEILRGLNASGHYGLVRELSPEYRHWLLRGYFNPWAGVWLTASVYMWWAQTFTESGGGGGSLPWIRSIITSDNKIAEDEVHELAHSWEEARTAEGLWTPQGFTKDVWELALGEWTQPEDAAWAQAFVDNPLGVDPEGYNETFASTASRIMGELSRLPEALRPYYQALFSR